MKIDLALHRDQRRLAVAKFNSLSEENPLRERYRDWIERLDEIISSIDLPARIENSNAPVTTTSQLDGVSDPSASRINLLGAMSQSPVGLGIGSPNSELAQQPGSAFAPQDVKLKMEKDFGKSSSEKAAVFRSEAKTRKDSLIAENRLLRCLLARFG